MKSHYIVNKIIPLDGLWGERYVVRKLEYCDSEFLEGYNVPGELCYIGVKLAYCLGKFKTYGYFTQKERTNREVAI